MTKKHGLIIAKPGFDARNCDVKDQVFNSDKNSLKVWRSGSTNISVSAETGSGGFGSVDIPHDLEYAPFYLVFFKLKHSTKLWMQDSLDTSMLMGNFIVGRAHSNDTNLNVSVSVNGDNLDAWTAVAYYYMFIDKAFE